MRNDKNGSERGKAASGRGNRSNSGGNTVRYPDGGLFEGFRHDKGGQLSGDRSDHLHGHWDVFRRPAQKDDGGGQDALLYEPAWKRESFFAG